MDVESLSTCLSGINIIIENQLRYFRISLQGLGNLLAKNSWVASTLLDTSSILVSRSFLQYILIISKLILHIMWEENSWVHIRSKKSRLFHILMTMAAYTHTYIGKCWDIKQASIKWVVAIEMTSHAAFSTIKKPHYYIDGTRREKRRTWTF